jgi:hypothetical protein
LPARWREQPAYPALPRAKFRRARQATL